MKDQRYKAIKSLIESKSILRFQDIFTIIPISTVKSDMKVNYNTLRRKIDNCELLTVKDMTVMAKLFDVQEALLFQIILSSVKTQPTVKRRTK